ncbi:hypothetical protein Tco_0345389 [Tanacetum coccineum]
MLSLTSCYPAFLITADCSLKCRCTKFWNSGVQSMTPSYRFKIDKVEMIQAYFLKLIFKISFRFSQELQYGSLTLPSEEDTVSFLRELGHTGEINSLNDVVVDQMHQPWRNFAALINRSLSGKTSGLDKLRLSRAQILWGMFHQKNVDYVELLWEYFIYQIDKRVYKKLRKRCTDLVSKSYHSPLSYSRKIYGDVIPECLTSPEMKESKAYKTYLDQATGDVPPKIARKFLNASSPLRKDSFHVSKQMKKPVQKGNTDVKRSAKKSSTTPDAGIVFRETPMKTKSTVKERVDVSRGKGIDLLSEVALAEKAQLKEITPTITSEGTSDKPGIPDVTEDDSTESESESWGNDEDNSNNEQEASDEDSGLHNESKEQEYDSEQDEESDNDNQEEEEVDQENELKDDEIESDEDKGMDDTTDQFDDYVDARLEEPTQTGKEVVQGEGVDVEMIDAQQGNENLETTQEQVVKDAHVTISTVTKKTEVPATSSSLQHEVPNTQTTTLLPIPVSVITTIPQSLQTFTPPPLVSTPTPPLTTKATNPPTTLPDFTSVF